MKASISVLLLCASLPASAWAQDVPVFWEKDVETALVRAQRLHRPILAAVHAPGNKVTQAFLRKGYTDPKVRRLLREYVCVVGTAKAFPRIQEGPGKGMSSAFLTLSFEEAKKVEQELRVRFLGAGVVSVPQHLILNSKGQLVNNVAGGMEIQELVDFLTKGLDRVSPGWNPGGEEKRGGKSTTVKILPTEFLFTGTEEQRALVLDQILGSERKPVLLGLYPKIKNESTKILVLEKIRFSHGDLGWQAPILLAAIQDESAKVRAHAAVNATGLASPGLADALLKAAKKEKVADVAAEKDIEALTELVQAVAVCGRKDRASRKWLFSLEKHRNAGVRKAFYVAMAAWAKDSKDKKVRSILFNEGLHDPDWAVRSAAIFSLAEMRYKKAVPEIKKMLARTQREWRKEFYPLALARMDGKATDPEKWEKARALLANERIHRPWTKSRE